MNRGPLLCIAVVLVCLVAACEGGGGSSTAAGGSSGGASGNTWVGKLADSNGYIAIMKVGTNHLIYVTDGREFSVWFEGNATGAVAGYFTFYNDEGGSIINNPAGDGFGGTVTVAPSKHFKYTTVPAKGDAGLYRAKDASGESAWIVLEDGSFRGAKVGGDGKIEALAARGGVKWTDPAADP